MGLVPHVGVKLIPKGDEAVIEANHVFSFSLTISTRRVELINSKEKVSDEALVIAKSISE